MTRRRNAKLYIDKFAAREKAKAVEVSLESQKPEKLTESSSVAYDPSQTKEIRTPIVEIADQMARVLRPTVAGGGIALKTPLFEKQRLLVEAPHLRIIIRAGRRGGKTTGCAIRAIRAFLSGHRVLYAAPVIEQVNRFWAEATRALEEPILAGIFYKNETKHLIELRGTEQAIIAKTAWNADSLRGDYGDLLILDEWQLMNEDAWGRVGAPMLLDNNGTAVFIYTPPSLHSRSVSKADDPKHAAKMFKLAEDEMKVAAVEGRVSRWLAITWPSHSNPAISEDALADITKDMTRLAYQQEIEAEDTTEVPGALWTQKLIDDNRITPDRLPELVRIVVGVDPTGSTTTEAGIVGAGIGVNEEGYVLEDSSILGALPQRWAAQAVSTGDELKADRIVAEQNYGGDMVESTIRQVDPKVSYRAVTATRGKLVRAEPICALYEQGKIHHVGDFPQLEEEMCSYVPGEKSPNRMDALVWALTDLMLVNQTLGLIDYLKGGAAQRELDAMNKVKAAGSLAKPVVADETPKCPECNSVCVIRVGGGELHCNQCGIQWKDKRTEPTDGQDVRRDQMLKTMGRRNL